MYMKKVFIFCLCAVVSLATFAQTSVSGTVIDAENSEPLIGVSIIEKGTSNGVVTDFDGNFSLSVSTNAVLQLSYVGYTTQEIKVGKKTNLGTIELVAEVVGLEDVTVVGQMAIQRKTPVAVSQVAALEIEERLGGQEFPEVLKNTPGVHANKQGGGWGDSEIYMRGFASENVAVMVNGIPMNDMENGTVYWSNWQGLSDVTSIMQTQRGLGASKVSAPSVGGTINIVTKGIDAKRGGFMSYGMGNDGYNKVAFSVSTGLMKNGWALSLLGSRTSGDGYFQGGDFEMYSYFINATKLIGDNHQLVFTGFGAPQKHYSRSNALTSAEWEKVRQLYNLKDWREFNPDYGFDSDGQRKTADYAEYHKPFVSLTHNWDINEKSKLNTNFFAAFGRGGSFSGKADERNFSEYDWYASDYGILNTTFRTPSGTYDYSKTPRIDGRIP